MQLILSIMTSLQSITCILSFLCPNETTEENAGNMSRKGQEEKIEEKGKKTF